jgi:hypothetical protein
MRTILFACLWMLTIPALGQVNTSVLNRYPSEFASAYAAFPQIPVGTLEAVAITQTNMTALGMDEPESCAGLPRAFGLFGLVEDGQGYFRNNLSLVSSLSGYPIYMIKENPTTQIMAYASALTHIVEGNDWTERGLAERLAALSALPSETPTQLFALESELYSVLSLLNDARFMVALGSTAHSYSLETVFGENLAVLSAAKVLINGEEVQSETGDSYRAGGGIAPCYNYASDVFVQTPTCNYSSRSGTAISAVTIHTIQGTYAGAVSWAQNCDAKL